MLKQLSGKRKRKWKRKSICLGENVPGDKNKHEHIFSQLIVNKVFMMLWSSNAICLFLTKIYKSSLCPYCHLHNYLILLKLLNFLRVPSRYLIPKSQWDSQLKLPPNPQGNFPFFNEGSGPLPWAVVSTQISKHCIFHIKFKYLLKEPPFQNYWFCQLLSLSVFDNLSEF